MGASGKSVPDFSRKYALYSATHSYQALRGTAVSSLTPNRVFMGRRRCSRSSFDIPITTVEYICTKRRYASYAKRSFFVAVARPATERSFSPRLRIVSIIPGMERAEPERTLTRRGFLGSPRFFFVSRSSLATFAATCFFMSGGYFFPLL